MRFLQIVVLCLAAHGMTAAEYGDIQTVISPCARDFFTTASKAGGLKNVRDEARARCLDGRAKECPDLWVIYAYTEFLLQGPDALKVCKEAVRLSPSSAAARYYYAIALTIDAGSGGAIRAFSKMGAIRSALEDVVRLDPDCHEMRIMLIGLYALPKLGGGDADNLKAHMAELERRDPYSAALAHGAVAYQKEDYAAAATFFKEAQRLKPEQSAPTKELLKVNVALGNFDEAFDLCLNLKPRASGSGARDELFVDLSARSGLRSEEALAASARFLSATGNDASPARPDVLINTAIILKRLGRIAESEQQVIAAEKQKPGSKKLFLKREKAYQSKAASVAAR